MQTTDVTTVDERSVAVVDRRGTSTYEELWQRAACLRGALSERGVRSGDPVLLITNNDRESVAAYHAIVGLGAVAVLSQVGSGASELRYAAEVSRPSLVLASPSTIRSIGTVPGVDPVSTEALAGPPTEALAVVDRDSPRVVVFTSGTTSVPKGVVHSGRSIDAAVACFSAILPVAAQDRFFLVSPLASITGVLQALEVAPAVGAAAVLEDDFNPAGSLDFLVASGATLYGGPDLVVDRLLRVAAEREVEVPLRKAMLGGAMLRRELVDVIEEGFGIEVVRVYGSSEAPCSTGTRSSEPSSVRLGDEGVPGTEVELRLSTDGELLVRGPHLFVDYLGAAVDDALTDGWFRTGDEAVLDGGRLRIVGRLKDVISRSGKKISLAEVDRAFTTATGIVDCASFGVVDPQTGERVAMAVRLRPDEVLDVPAVLTAMETMGLARWKLPEVVVRVSGQLPVTATGKVRRRDLVEGPDVLWRAPRLQF